MQTNDLATQALQILTPYVSVAAGRVVDVAQAVATRAVGDLVSDRLAGTGHADAFEAFAHSPQEHEPVLRYLLVQATESDADFRAQLEQAAEGALAAGAGAALVPVQQTITLRDGNAQIGDRGDTFGDGARVVTGAGRYHEGDDVNVVNHDKKPGIGRYALFAVAAAVVVIVVIALKVKPAIDSFVQSAGLSASSSCQDFLDADAATEQQAMVDIATAKGYPGFGSPLALPEIRYECSDSPKATLGSVIDRDAHAF
jgi:hypothetical protein